MRYRIFTYQLTNIINNSILQGIITVSAQYRGITQNSSHKSNMDTRYHLSTYHVIIMFILHYCFDENFTSHVVIEYLYFGLIPLSSLRVISMIIICLFFIPLILETLYKKKQQQKHSIRDIQYKLKQVSLLFLFTFMLFQRQCNFSAIKSHVTQSFQCLLINTELRIFRFIFRVNGSPLLRHCIKTSFIR